MVKWVNELDPCFLLVKGFWKLESLMSCFHQTLKQMQKWKWAKNYWWKSPHICHHLEWNWHILQKTLQNSLEFYKRLCKTHWSFTKANTQSNNHSPSFIVVYSWKTHCGGGYMRKNVCKTPSMEQKCFEESNISKIKKKLGLKFKLYKYT